MRQRSKGPLAAPARRRMLKQTTALGAVAIAAPYVLRSAHAQANADIAPYQQAKINWRQAEGEEITIAFIPASYFDNLIALAADVRGAVRRQSAIREGAARPDPAKGNARPFVENGDVRNVGDRSDVLPAVRVQQMGGAARQVPW